MICRGFRLGEVDVGSSQGRVGLGTEGVVGGLHVILKKKNKREQKWFEQFCLQCRLKELFLSRLISF